jgi:hypothetical protein
MKNTELFPDAIPHGIAVTLFRDPLQGLLCRLQLTCLQCIAELPPVLQQRLADVLNLAVSEREINDYVVSVDPNGKFADVMIQPTQSWQFQYVHIEFN